MCSYICICFYIGFTRNKTLTMLYCAAFGYKHDLSRYRELSWFLFPLKKPTVVKQSIHNCGRAGWKHTRYVRLCSANFEESCFEVDIFSSTNGSRSFKMSATENVKPEAVTTIFRHVPQQKASTQGKHSIKRIVQS